MKTREFGILIIRLFALWLLFQGILNLEQLGINVFSPLSDDIPTKRYLSFLYFGQMMLYFIVGFILIAKTNWILDPILPHEMDEGNIPYTSKQEMAILSYSLAGFYLLITGLQSFIYQIISWFTYPKPSFAPNVSQYKFDKPALFVSMFSVSVGIILIVTPGGFLRLLKWFRGMGQQIERQG